MRGYELIVQRNALEMRAGDDFQTAVFNRGIGQVVVQEYDLRPGRATDGIVPLHPVLVPVEGRPFGFFGEDDDAAIGFEISKAQLFECPPRRRPVQQFLDDRIVFPPHIDVLTLVFEIFGRVVIRDQPLGFLAQFPMNSSVKIWSMTQ